MNTRHLIAALALAFGGASFAQTTPPAPAQQPAPMAAPQKAEAEKPMAKKHVAKKHVAKKHHKAKTHAKAAAK